MISSIRILEWSAWTPGISTRKEWIEFFRSEKRRPEESVPDVSEIPALLRRRMSRLTRMSVAVATECCRRAAIPASDVPLVFASRHGEMSTTVDLLNQLAAKEPVSPMSFSGSVHHTALGYFSLATLNRQAARAVGGGEASFCYGFLDAAGLLAETRGPVLLVAADDVLPAPFADLIEPASVPYAAAFLLERSLQAQADTVSLEMPSPRPAVHPNAARTRLGVPALDFLRWFLEGKKTLDWYLSERLWRWKK